MVGSGFGGDTGSPFGGGGGSVSVSGAGGVGGSGVGGDTGAGGMGGTISSGGAPSSGGTSGLGGALGGGGTPGALGGSQGSLGGSSAGLGGVQGGPGGSHGGAGGWSLGGASRCAGSTYAVCQDFEATAAGSTPAGNWSLPTSNYGTGTVTVASDSAARGSHSLKVTIAAGGSTERYLQLKNLGALASGHFGRIFFRIQGPTATSFIHWDLILGAGPYMGQNRRIRWGNTGTGVGTTSGNWSWIYNIEQGDTGVEARTSHPVLNTWMCVEWQWDATNQKIRFYFNDAEVQALHVDTTLPNGTALQVPTFTSLNFGLAKYQNTTTDLAFWIDEIALDTQRIGCAN
jgi:hypothetical protein